MIPQILGLTALVCAVGAATCQLIIVIIQADRDERTRSE